MPRALPSELSRRAGQPASAGPPEGDWRVRGHCRDRDPDELFVPGRLQNAAAGICRECPVRAACLAYALDNRIAFGVWGGLTERERRALLRRHPDVADWTTYIDDHPESADRREARGA